MSIVLARISGKAINCLGSANTCTHFKSEIVKNNVYPMTFDKVLHNRISQFLYLAKKTTTKKQHQQQNTTTTKNKTKQNKKPTPSIGKIYGGFFF